MLAPAAGAAPRRGVVTDRQAATLTARDMSSRQQEKERRRQERLAREQAERAAHARRRRLQFALTGLLVLVVVGGIAALAAGVVGGGGGGEPAAGEAQTPQGGAKLPAPQIGDLKAAAKAANCKVVDADIEGATHEDKEFKPSDYKTNPPTSGNHNPDWYQDGVYLPGDVPRLGMLVHPLEHGRIEVQYKPGTPERTVAQLESLLAEQEQGYHMLMFQNTTNMPYQVAATAWGHLVGCPQMNDKVFDVLRDFRTQYIDQGPEKVD